MKGFVPKQVDYCEICGKEIEVKDEWRWINLSTYKWIHKGCLSDEEKGAENYKYIHYISFLIGGAVFGLKMLKKKEK